MIVSPTLRQTWPRELPEAAMCVQDVDVQCVLQFTLIHAAGCALHRPPSRVIHHLELYKQRCQIRPTEQHSTRAPRFGHEDRTPRLDQKNIRLRNVHTWVLITSVQRPTKPGSIELRLTFHKARSRRSSSSVFEVTEPVRLRHPRRRPPWPEGRRVGAHSTSPRPSRGAPGGEPWLRLPFAL